MEIFYITLRNTAVIVIVEVVINERRLANQCTQYGSTSSLVKVLSKMPESHDNSERVYCWTVGGVHFSIVKLHVSIVHYYVPLAAAKKLSKDLDISYMCG